MSKAFSVEGTVISLRKSRVLLSGLDIQQLFKFDIILDACQRLNGNDRKR